MIREFRYARTESARPFSTEELRADIRAAGERCKKARAQGWIDEQTERLPDPDEKEDD